MAITWAANVQIIAPELSTTATAAQNLILALVDRMVDDAAWGEFADDGKTYLAAHLGTVSGSGSGSGSGAVTEEKIGPLSRSYADPSSSDNDLATTKYGRFYKYLMRTALGVAALVP
jgi:hypothetical protein